MAEVTSTTSSYDYSMIGSIGSEAAQSVNGDMINKIRAAEEKAKIDPITEDIENIALETEKMEEIKTKVSEFQDFVSYFDLYNDENVFNQYHFDTTGTSAVFDAVNMSNMQEGTTTVEITQLAQRDVFQSTTVGSKDGNVASGTLSIQVGTGTAIEFDTSVGMTYDELASAINKEEGLSASMEQVGDSEYRLIVKSTESGEANVLTISGLDLGFNTGNKQVNSSSISDTSSNPTAGQTITIVDSLGADEVFTFDGSTSFATMVSTINDHADFNASINSDNEIEITMADGSDVTISTDVTDLSFSGENLNHTQKAQNMNATIDGIDYDVSSSSITTQGSLEITGLELGSSTITVSKDTDAITVAAEAMVTQYNELQELLNDEIYSGESVIEDKSILKDILADLKNMLFSSYGASNPEYGDAIDEYGDIVKAHSNVTNNDMNIFVFGFELDKSGSLTIDTDTFEGIINGEDDNYTVDDLKNVFTGSYENKGLGVQLSEYLDGLDSYEGKFYNFDIDIVTKKEDLEEDKTEEIERLDAKYGIMAEQFSAYSSLIAQMEASFNGLKMMIEQSTSGN